MEYKSPSHKLVRVFEKSRDNWKQKYQQAQKEIKSLHNKLYYQKQKQIKQEQHMQVLEQENQTLKTTLEELNQQRQKEKDQVKKSGEMLEMRAIFEQKIPYHQYSIGIIRLLLQLVFEGANHLRTSARSMQIIGTLLPGIATDISWYSIRLWAMRLGYYELTRAKEKADDWVWIIDHSIQLGHEKCLLIVGCRLNEYKEKRRPRAAHADI